MLRFLIGFLRNQSGTSTVEAMAIIAGSVALAASAIAVVETGAIDLGDSISTTSAD